MRKRAKNEADSLVCTWVSLGVLTMMTVSESQSLSENVEYRL
jgi:hypothetical protein